MPKQLRRRGTRLGRPDLRPRLKPGHVRCAKCGEPLLEVVAVRFAGELLHPIGCFDQVLEQKVSALRAGMSSSDLARTYTSRHS